jgi:tape measure domain-containing protein
MTDPKIRYDVEAGVTGRAEVDQLGRSLEELGDAIPAGTADRAKELADAIDLLGKQQGALTNYKALGDVVRATTRDVAQAEAKFDDLRREIEASGEISTVQSGRLQKLSDELQRARDRADGAKQALAGARTQLTEFGLAGTTLAGTGEALKGVDKQATELRDEIKSLSGEIGKLREGSEATKVLEAQFKALGIQGVRTVEVEVKKLQQALAAIRGNADVLPADKARAVEAFNQRLAELRREAGGATTSLDGVGKSAESTGQTLATAAQRAVAWTAAIAGIGGGGQLVRNVIDTGAAFETLRGRLESLLGSTQAADEAFERIKTLAATTPFEVSALTESFAKLTAFGLSPTDDMMRALADTAATLGGGTEVLAGVTTALGQAWAKGKLQGEEILQLTERGVPVWDALARATGKSVEELNKLSSTGALGRDVIRALIDELGRNNFGASAKLMNTFNGAVSNAKDALAEFYDLIARSGVLEYLTGQLQEALAAFERLKDTGELERRAKAVADTFVAVAEAAGTAIDVLISLSGAIELLVKAMIAQRVLAFVSSLNLLGPAAAAATTQVRAAAVGMQTAGVATAALGTASTLATGALARMGLALASLAKVAGPLLLVEVIGRLAFNFFEAKAAAEESDRAVRRMLEEPPRRNAPQAAAVAATEALTTTATAAQKAGKEIERIASGGGDTEKRIQDIARAAEKLLLTTEGVKEFGKALSSAFFGGKLAAEDADKAWTRAIGDLSAEELPKFQTAAKEAFEAGRFGAQTLADVLNKAARQAVKNAGADFEALATGVSESVRKTLGQVDGLVQGFEALRAQGVDTSKLIFEKLSEAIRNSKTEEELQAIERRVVAIGRAAPGAATQVTDALDAIGKRAAELGRQLDQVTRQAEADAKRLGITLRANVVASAEEGLIAFERLKLSGKASAEEITRAFVNLANEQIRAAGGVVPEWVKVEAQFRGAVVQYDNAGKAVVRTMEEAERAASRTGERMRGLSRDAAEAATGVQKLSLGFADLEAAARKSGDAYREVLQAMGGLRGPDYLKARNESFGGPSEDSFNALYNATPDGGITRTGSAQFQPPDNSGDWVFDQAAYARAASSPTTRLSTVDPRSFWRRKSGAMLGPDGFPEGWGKPGNGFPAGWPVPASAPAPSAGTQFEAASGGRGQYLPGGGVQIVFNFGTRAHTVNAASVSAAEALMRDLESAYRQAGGGS